MWRIKSSEALSACEVFLFWGYIYSMLNARSQRTDRTPRMIFHQVCQCVVMDLLLIGQAGWDVIGQWSCVSEI